MTEALEYRRQTFRKEPCVGTARFYATELFDHFADDLIGNDTLRAGLAELAEGLTAGACDLGGPAAAQRPRRR